ncbi:peptidase S8 and S53 subtilisin kexin sedolisin [Bacillus cereus]|nr:peptidase S8 and S53 subtilisin kexin sedolisin [Bacillus cereus]
MEETIHISGNALPPIVYAEASVRSVGGESIFETEKMITHENVHRYYNKPELVDIAVEKLKRAGFEVLNIGSVTINIAASPETYERTFNTKIIPEERKVIKSGTMSTATFLDVPETDLSGLIDISNSALADVLEGVALNEPMYYLSLEPLSNLSSPTPPTIDSYYLNVPDDISHLLGADKIHQAGVTGRGIKVVMIDSGWYRHPYFTQRGYHANPVVLGPGASNPTHDKEGHGTGESANVFALAPEVNFTMVKQGSDIVDPTIPTDNQESVAIVNATGNFNAAVELNPHVISCSWGFDERHQPPLSAAEKTLSAAIADAVSQGICVVFSAGNGHFAFPGQHPDVISAGGVYVSENGSMQASNYASGFKSPLFPGRLVPDICGLVGMQPRAQYIMLPVESGDNLDKEEANIDPRSNSSDVDGTFPNDGWARFSGTSAAAPQLAGICALLKQVNPSLSPQKIKEILIRTATDITEGQNFQGEFAQTGRDLATGFGLAHAERAVQMARNLH